MLHTNRNVALITGANKGIGFEAARQLGHAGFTVLIGARNLVLGRQAAATLQAEQVNAHALELDLTRQETIDAAAATITRDFNRLDVLINNAGIADPGDGPPTSASIEVIERTLHTNFLGAIRVTQAMLPLLRQAPAARIVNVSSGLGSVTQQADPAYPFGFAKFLGYSASKAALNMFTAQLSCELRDTPIKVNSSDPGYTATDLNQHRGHQTIPEGTAETVRLALLPQDGPTGTFSDNAGPVPW